MAWPWRRERGRHAGPPLPRPVSAPASPAPYASAPAPSAVVPVVAEPAPLAPAVATQAASAKPDAPEPVRLGFNDGTEVALSAGDPRAQALREIADVLLHRRSG